MLRTIYTQGGINTIVWVDVFQIFIILPILLVLTIVGSAQIGHTVLWDRVAAGERGLVTDMLVIFQ